MNLGMELGAAVRVRREEIDTAGDAAALMLDKARRADAALRTKIAILYPPLPVDYWWVSELLVDGFGVPIFRIRYHIEHVDRMNAAQRATAWRP